MGRPPNPLRRRALRVIQDDKHPLFMFVLTAEEFLKVADISRVSRDEAGRLLGYQRKEVRRHVNNIIEYLDSSNRVLFPNSIILAMSSEVDFKEARGPKVDEGVAQAGTLTIPLPRNGESKPAWIVDGQQRALALSRCRRRDLKIPVNAFLADDVSVQREQFPRINSTKPLPHGLITELLPEVDTVLPANLAARKAPAKLCDMLAQDPRSPFHKLIRRTSQSGEESQGAVVTDTVVIKMLEQSLKNPSGALFSFRNIATGQTDFNAIGEILRTYWTAVKLTFPSDWGLPPERSRLMHGVGIRAMGLLMDRIMGTVNPTDRNAPALVLKELAPLKATCKWTSREADDALRGMAWNELQCVHGHIALLSNHLIQSYLSARRAA